MSPRAKPIRLLFSSIHCILDPTSGAAKSVRTMLSQLVTEGIDCTVFTGPAFDTQKEPSFSELGATRLPQNIAENLLHVPQDSFRHYISPINIVAKAGRDIAGVGRDKLSEAAEIAFTHETMTMIGIAQPSVILVYGDGVHERALLRRCRAIGIKTIFYLTNPTYNDPSLFEFVDGIVTDSRATQSLYRDRLDLSLNVVGKFIAPPAKVPKMLGEDLLFINPLPEKGVMLVLAIARECARRSLKFRFRIVESRFLLKDAIFQSGFSDAGLENIVCVPGGESLDDHFEAAKILLLPSLWHESGSRSLLEACAHGVPVVASDRGGTPELLGNGGLTLPMDPALDGRDWATPSQTTVDIWTNMIERLMTDSDYYKVRQTAALKRWRAYKIKSSTTRIKRQMERLVS